MDNMDFTEEEIQQQLEALGYNNISKHRLQQFKEDLNELIQSGDWKTVPLATKRKSSTCPTVAAQHSPAAYTKEKVTRWPLECPEGFFLHAANNDDNGQVLNTHQTTDYKRQQRLSDPYANHSVAPKPQLPLSAPSCLQGESDSEDTLHSPFTDSCASSLGTQRRPFIKRKVFRKHKGRSLVCDESVYSEDSGVRITSMYKMYSTQLDEETEDDSSSFWSDGEKQDDDEKVERVMEEEDSGPEDKAGRCLKTSEEDEPELIHQGDSDRESFEDGTDDAHEDEDNDDEDSCSSSSDSPAPSLMTSGYGTYRPEEQEAGSHRDDHTMTELDQDSRGDLSEMRDDDDRSLCSFGGFDIESVREPDDEPEGNMECHGDDGVRNKDVNLEEDRSHTDEQEPENDAVTDAASEEKHHVSEAQDGFLPNEKHVEDEREDVQQDLKEHKGVDEEVEDKVESEDPDETSSNKDIKFIDSQVDFSWTLDEWEGTFRQKKDAVSSLEEHLAGLRLSTPAEQDFETGSEDLTSQSDTYSSEDQGISLSAFESYLQGMTQSVGDLRPKPKPKSFIRPVISRQTIKKTDPVAKYFQYKQLWNMFKFPGERDRSALRLEVREQLAYQPPLPKPRRVYAPNTYIVPTEKKRSALRWEIRNNLANGLLPHKFSC